MSTDGAEAGSPTRETSADAGGGTAPECGE